MWGGAQVASSGVLSGERTIGALWIDAVLLVGVFGMAYGLYQEAHNWHTVVPRHAVEISLSPWYLPWYTFQSLSRGLIAYFISLLFTLGYAYWAAKDHRAERVLIPLLDILQSIPVLGFLPGLVIALVALFPKTNTGLELAAILMIFTGQVWNMTFSLYRSLRTVPREQQEAATIFGFSLWQRVTKVELPFATLGLVWNSMMSMAGGWFYLMIIEAFQLQNQDFRLPGLGSYMSVACDAENNWAKLWGILAMIFMIVVLDQLLWRPLVAWAQKFRVEDGAQEVTHSWFLDFLRRSRLAAGVTRACARSFERSKNRERKPVVPAVTKTIRQVNGFLSLLPLVVLIGVMCWGTFELFSMLRHVSKGEWVAIAKGTGLTSVRVVTAIILGTLWTVPVGLAIGLSPKLSRLLQPIVQIAASFPAPMLFPVVVGVMSLVGINLGFSSIILLLLSTQWYILFNVIAGAMTIPADLREAARTYGVKGMRIFRQLYLPAIFPYLVTGWVTSMGGAWNASIVSEYMKIHGQVIHTTGLGALMSQAVDADKLNVLAASVVVMSLVVVGINRLLWKRLYHLAETTYCIDK